MRKKTIVTLLIGAVTTGLSGISLARTPAPAPAQPLFATTRVEGIENVYIFRYQNHQAMFVVTPGGGDRHRSDQVWPAAGGEDLSRENRLNHQGPGQIL